MQDRVVLIKIANALSRVASNIAAADVCFLGDIFPRERPEQIIVALLGKCRRRKEKWRRNSQKKGSRGQNFHSFNGLHRCPGETG